MLDDGSPSLIIPFLKWRLELFAKPANEVVSTHLGIAAGGVLVLQDYFSTHLGIAAGGVLILQDYFSTHLGIAAGLTSAVRSVGEFPGVLGLNDLYLHSLAYQYLLKLRLVGKGEMSRAAWRGDRTKRKQVATHRQ